MSRHERHPTWDKDRESGLLFHHGCGGPIAGQGSQDEALCLECEAEWVRDPKRGWTWKGGTNP